MASLQEAGQIILYAVKPSGHKTQIASAPVSSFAPAGGAPDSLGASVVTPEKQTKIFSPVKMVNDDTLQVAYIPVAADGIDVSDCHWAISCLTPSGSKILSIADFTSPTPADFTGVAGKEIVFGGHAVTEGFLQVWGTVYIDAQDDT